MSLDDRTSQEKLTPEERRTLLRAFADRMLLKVSAMDDPEDMPGVEKAVRVAAGIERIYYRCDRAERQTPDPRKVEVERATNHSAAIKARVYLANDLEWGEQRQKQLGKWWDAAGIATQTPIPSPVVMPVASQTVTQAAAPQPSIETPAAQGAALQANLNTVPEKIPSAPEETYTVIDYTDAISKWRIELGLPEFSEDEREDWPIEGRDKWANEWLCPP